MKNNYETAYAAMPIYDSVASDKIECYIVSRCYIMSEESTYLPSGEEIKKYNVFFPYVMVENDRFRRIDPEANSLRKYGYKFTTVDDVAYDAREAKEMVD